MDTRPIPRASIVARWSPADQAVDLVANGKAVIDVVDPHRQWGVSPFARRFTRRSPRQWPAEYRGVFGNRDKRLSGGELEVAVCSECGDPGCGNPAVDFRIDADTVAWVHPHWAGHDEDDEVYLEPDANDPTSLLPPVLVFNRAEFDVALADAERLMTRRWRQRDTPSTAMWLDRLRKRLANSRDI